jgi:hypothetical protein
MLKSMSIDSNFSDFVQLPGAEIIPVIGDDPPFLFVISFHYMG